jgi:acetoin utilization deacetylase AcuC-like enzyme
MGDTRLLVVYHPDFSALGYPPLQERVAPVFEYIKEQGYLDREGVEVLTPEPADLAVVECVHTRRHVADVDQAGQLEVSLLSTGGVVEASERLAKKTADNAFCFVGAAGHHASAEGFWGFCFINDIGVAAKHLLDEGMVERVAVIDIDPHFGDGTRDILGPDSRVLHVNFHSGYGRRTLDSGPNNFDVGLSHDAADDTFINESGNALYKARDFDPDILFIVFGYDSHIRDYGAFQFTANAFRRFAVTVKEYFPTGVCYVLSGGADIEVGKEAIGGVIDELSK